MLGEPVEWLEGTGDNSVPPQESEDAPSQLFKHVGLSTCTRFQGTLTIDTIKLMGIAKFLYLLRKRFSCFLTLSQARKLVAASASADRHNGLYMWVFGLQFGNCCKAAFLTIDLHVVVGPFVESLRI